MDNNQQQTQVNQQEQVNNAPKIKLTRKEKRRLRIIKRLIAGEINGPKAAKLLNISTRQVRNLKRQVLLEGDIGIVHKNRFHKPVNTYDEEIRE
ncbi:MAG TPA: helix-turn-helix domain-containing protein, partial [Bacilli bacterium]|nr:helix-turn-helix domain-containing protein [Bacilli bacterium]